MDFDELPSAQQGIDLADELFGQPLPLLASFDHDLEPQPAPSVAMDEDPTLTSAPAPDALEDDDDEAGDDLFGDDGLDGDDDMADGEQLSDDEIKRRRLLEYEEDDAGRDDVPEKRVEQVAEITLANYAIPAGGKVWHARLPNFLALDKTAFEPAQWIEAEEDRDVAKEETKEEGKEEEEESASQPKPAVPDENVLRWRWGVDEHGAPLKESNSRIVQWSDGSLSLQVGTELFDITAALDHSATHTSAPGYSAANSDPSAVGLSSFDPNRGHGLTYLTASHEYTELDEAQASIHGTMTFRPTTLQSKTHRLLAGNIAGRFVKVRAMKQALTVEDPERKKAEAEKAEADKAKKAARALNKGKESSGRKKERGRTRLVNGSDEEEDDDQDEEMRTGEERRSNPRRGKKGPLAQDDEEEDYDNDGFVVGSDDEGVTNRRNDEEEDEMEEMEARIDREEARRLEQKKRSQRGEAPRVEPVQQPSRRLVIESDDDDE